MTVKMGVSWMGVLILLRVKSIECGMVRRSLDLTLIVASVNLDRLAVSLSTSTNPPLRSAIDSKILVFHESKGSPRM